MRALCVFLLLVWSCEVWAERLFIPLDAEGNPVEEAAAPEASVSTESGESENDRLIREAAEADHAQRVVAATEQYVSCLQREQRRWFGSDYALCDNQSVTLGALYPSQSAEQMLNCLFVGTTESVAAAAAICPVATSTLDNDNTGRWK